MDAPEALGEGLDGYVTSDEAIAILDVKRETLYAYASRGLVRSVPGPRGRPRRYARADVERLRQRHDARAGHAAVAADALRWGEPVLDSALTEVTAAGPRVRGVVLAEEAARATPIEVVAERVWGSGLGLDAWRAAVASRLAPALALVARALPHASAPRLLDHLVLANDVLGVMAPHRYLTSPAAEHARARDTLRVFAAALALPDLARARATLVRDAPLAVRILGALGLDEDGASRRAIDTLLVALADHELNASTFAARVAASAGADLHACLAAGLAALSGPKHGGACDRVEALVREVGEPRASGPVVAARLARGDAVPGFGHPLYPAGDPRTPPVLAIARRLARSGARRVEAGRDEARRDEARRAARTLLAVVDRVAELRGEPPAVDLASVAVTLALGAPPGSSTALFAIGRTVGWVAHAIEQRESSALLRPRARYTGPGPA